MTIFLKFATIFAVTTEVIDILDGTYIGKIEHFYNKISVAAVELREVLNVGDNIRVIGDGGIDFTQPVESMEIEHRQVKKAKKGDIIGVKVKQRVHRRCLIYRIEPPSTI